MQNKETRNKVRQWNSYFHKKLSKGLSWNNIRNELIAIQGYKSKSIELLIYNYKLKAEKAAKRRITTTIVACVLLLCMFIPMILIKPTITGKVTGGFGNNYYVDSVAGNDANNGLSLDTPIKTITKVNTLNLLPGDSVLFKRGSRWRLIGNDYPIMRSGDSTAAITYDAYGTGNKPEFWGSYNMSNPINWTECGTNLWCTTLTADVGNVLVYGNETSLARKDVDETLTNRQWKYDETSNILTIYATSNPATLFSSIEVPAQNQAKQEMLFKFDSKSYITVANLSLKYFAAGGLNGEHMTNITWKYNDLRYGGGDWQIVGTNRYGNCLDVQLEAHNIIIMGNNVSYCYDGALTIEGYSSGGYSNQTNIEVAYNIFSYSHYGIEWFNSYATNYVDNINIHHNTIAYIGQDWTYGNDERFLDMAKGEVRIDTAPILTSNFKFTNNIIHSEANLNYLLDFSRAVNDWKGDIPIINYNLYYDAISGVDIGWNGTLYPSLASFRTAHHTIETNGAEANPLFVDAANGDYRPSAGNPACTMSSTGSYVGALPCASSEPEPFCGDDVCDGTENCSTCESDCGICQPVNNPPTQSNPIMNASDNPINSTNATLNCYNQSTADADGDRDTVTNSYRWFRNSSLVASLSGSSVDAGNTSVGDSWTCEVKPYDGEDYGTARNSSALVILAACGDGSCNGNENCTSCEADCGICPPEPFCGDSVCNGLENCTSCESDCGVCPPEPFCGDLTCNGLENCTSCSSDCGVCPVNTSLNGCVLADKSWNEDENQTSIFNLSSCFHDALSQSLTFTSTGTANILVSIGANGIVNLTTPTNWNGVEHVVFSATEGNRTNSTNSVTLTVNAVADCGDSVCESGESHYSCPADCEEEPAASPSSGGGGGGGGGSSAQQTNDTDWSCGNWSECVNKKQSQICTHTTKDAQKTNTRSCTTAANPTGESKKEDTVVSDVVKVKENVIEESNTVESETKPAEEQTPGAIKQATTPDITSTIIYGLLAAAVLGAFVYGNLRNRRKASPVAVDIDKALHSYVSEAAKRGYSKEKVRSDLQGAGWMESVIEETLGAHHAEFVPEEVQDEEEQDV